VFGVKRRSVTRYEEHVKKLNDKTGFIDLFWPGVLILEQKSAARDLEEAYGQAGEYFDAIKEAERPRFILVSDFQTFELHDLDEREKSEFTLADLPKSVEKLGFILGYQKLKFRDQDPVNIKAAELVGKLHDALEESGYTGHNLERFLVRLVPIAETRRRHLDEVTYWADSIKVVPSPIRHRPTGISKPLSMAPFFRAPSVTP
jgi:hypothetical protein